MEWKRVVFHPSPMGSRSRSRSRRKGYTTSENTGTPLVRGGGGPGLISEPGCPGFLGGQEYTCTVKTSGPTAPIPGQV